MELSSDVFVVKARKRPARKRLDRLQFAVIFLLICIICRIFSIDITDYFLFM